MRGAKFEIKKFVPWLIKAFQILTKSVNSAMWVSFPLREQLSPELASDEGDAQGQEYFWQSGELLVRYIDVFVCVFSGVLVITL